MICKICNKELNNYGFPRHLYCLHNMNTQEYYDKYYKQQGEDICLVCGNKTTFKGLHKGGYHNYCSVKCMAKDVQNKQSVRNKAKTTLLQKYGITCSCNTCSNDYRYEQTKKAVQEKYGVDNVFLDDNIKNKIIKNKKEMYDIFEIENNCTSRTKLIMKYGYGWVYTTEIDIPFILYKHKYFVDNTYIHIIEQYWNEHQEYSISLGEKQILQTLEDNYDKQINIHTRKIIPPLELDFYLPDIKLAIEYNSNYYHSKEHGIPDDYHIQKSIKCKEKDVRLIHIFEFEDMEEQLNLLLNFLSGVDEYGNNFNKNNFLDTYTNGIIYKDKRHTIYGAL